MVFSWSSCNTQFSTIADELDNMLIAMLSKKWTWDFKLVKSYMVIVRMVCKQLKEAELIYAVQKHLLMKHFWKLPPQSKWQPLSLMTDYLSNGGVMNDMGNKVSKKIAKTELESMIRTCPDKSTKHLLMEFRIYYKK